MTESEKEKKLKEQKDQDQKEAKLENRRQIANLIEKYCRGHLKASNKDIFTCPRQTHDYIEFRGERNQCKIYYQDPGFREQVQKNLRSQQIPTPDWLFNIE